MYKKIETSLTSRIDDLNLSVLMMVPVSNIPNNCKGIVQILHGMSEYKERYLPVMRFLAENGYASIIHDHRGHGKSIKSIADLGYMYGAGYEGFLDDVLLVNEYAHKQVPGVPFILFGHSMGTLAARSFLREHDECVDKVILSGPPCKNSAVDMGILVAKMQKALRGGRCPGKLLESISIGNYRKAFKNENSNSAWICSDKEIVQRYEKDPLSGFTFTVDGYLVLLNLLKHTYLESGWKCSKPDLPIMYLGGEEDPCINGEKNFTEEIEVMKKVGYRRVSGKLYQGMRHEICNEIEKDKVFVDILAFLEK